jgi:hypothetical protein
LSDREAITIRPRLEPDDRTAAKVEARREREGDAIEAAKGRLVRRIAKARILRSGGRRVLAAGARASGLGSIGARAATIAGAKVVIAGTLIAAVASKLTGRTTAGLATDAQNILFGGLDIEARAGASARNRIVTPTVAAAAVNPGVRDQLASVFDDVFTYELIREKGKRVIDSAVEFDQMNTLDMLIQRVSDLIAEHIDTSGVIDSALDSVRRALIGVVF